MNRKTKVLLGLFLSATTLTSCFGASLGSELRWFSTNGSQVVTSAQEKSEILENIKNLKLNDESPNSNALSINLQLTALFVTSNIVGYGYYDYDPNLDTSTFKFESSSQTKLSVNLAADKKISTKLNLLGFDIFNIVDQQLNFDAKPLHELVDLSFIGNIDPSIIKEYRKSSYQSTYLKALEKTFKFNVLVIDASYLNNLSNNSTFVFTEDLSIGIFTNYSDNKLSIITIEGSGKFNNALDINFSGFVYDTYQPTKK